MLKILLLSIFTLFGNSNLFAKDQAFAKKFGKDLDSFCKISGWKKGLNTKTDIGYDLYEKLKIAKPVDAKFTISKLKKDGWVVVDARNNEARKAVGKISGALLLTADYNSPAKDQFEVKTLMKKFSKKKFKKHLKKRSIASVSKLGDLKNMKFVVFCNGFKCHRSSWAACQLRKHGVSYDNVSIALGGFSELKKAGASIK